jgi:predicted solute-binding protein
LGIASNGAVRSIFLVSHVAADKIRSVALDTSSRTSAVLARIILAQKYSNLPRTFPYAPLVNKMLNVADAALVIGDPALRLAPEQNGYYVYDLGREWTEMTGLPMVYAVWAGRRAAEAEALLHASYQYGRDHIEDIVQKEAIPRGVPVELARKYLTQHIVYELSEQHERGLDLYLKLAASV